MKGKFFAFTSRLKYINRWALMRNTTYENLSQHSGEVATIAHALAVIAVSYTHLDVYKRQVRYSQYRAINFSVCAYSVPVLLSNMQYY